MKSHISLAILQAMIGITLLSPYALEAMSPEKEDVSHHVPTSRAARQEAFLDIVERYMNIPPDAARGFVHNPEFIRHKEKGYSDKKALYLRERDFMLTLLQRSKPRFQSAWTEQQTQLTNFFSRVYTMFAHFQRDVYNTEGRSAEEAHAIRRASYPIHVHPHLVHLQKDLIDPFFAKLVACGIINSEDPYGIIPIKDGCFLGFQKDEKGGYLPFVGKMDGPYRLYRIHYGLDNIMGEQAGFLIGHGGIILTEKGFYVERMGFSDDLRMQVYNGLSSSSPFTLHQRILRLRERDLSPADTPALSHSADAATAVLPVSEAHLPDDIAPAADTPALSHSADAATAVLPVPEAHRPDDIAPAPDTPALSHSADAATAVLPVPEAHRPDDIAPADASILSHLADATAAVLPVSEEGLPDGIVSTDVPSYYHDHSFPQEPSRARIFTGAPFLDSMDVLRSMFAAQEEQGETSLFIPLPTTEQDAAYVELLLLESGEEDEVLRTEHTATAQHPLFLEQSRASTVVDIPEKTEPLSALDAGDARSAEVVVPTSRESQGLRQILLEEIIEEVSPPKPAPQEARAQSKQKSKGGKGKVKKHQGQKDAIAAADESDDTTAARISALRDEAQRILNRRLTQTKLKFDKLLKLLNGIRSDMSHSATRHGLASDETVQVVTNGSHNVFHDDVGAFLIARPHGGDFQYAPRVANRLLERWTQSFLTSIERRTAADTPPTDRSPSSGRRRTGDT